MTLRTLRSLSVRSLWRAAFGLLFIAALSAPPAAVLAQAAPTVVTATKLVESSPTETKLILDLNQTAPPLSIITNDRQDIEITLASTVRGPAASLASTSTALLRNIQFSQNERVLTLAITGKTVLHADATIDGALRVVITFSPEKEASAVETAAGALPKAAAPTPGQDSYELVMLKYADVSEVVGLLTDGLTVKSNDTFVAREPAFGSNSLTGGGNVSAPSGTGEADTQPLGQSVDSAIAIDRRLNAVWLKGSPERIAALKAEIALIDIPVDSVILETQLVELDDSAAKQVGIDLTNQNGQLAVFTAQSGQYVPNGDLPNVGSHLNAANEIVGGMLTSGQMQAAIYAQVSKGRGKIVSRPRIAAPSGGTAKIITGDALPILTNITLSGVNGVSQQVQYVNVGVTLQIAPRVSSDGFVTSHVFCVVSSVTGYSGGYPTISQREADTSATVKDGETFVIGGLTQDTLTSNDAKVPLLGDVPLLGQAFHNKNVQKQKTDLYIVVTPHVVHRVMPATATAAAAPPPDAAPPADPPAPDKP